MLMTNNLFLNSFLILFGFFFQALAQNNCFDSYTTSKRNTPESYIRKVPGDFLVFMRSNPAASLAWFRDKAIIISAESMLFKKIVSHVGIIAADAKPDNVDIVKLKNKSDKADIGIIDVDDGGTGMFLADLFHTLSYNKVWPNRLSFEDAIDSYKLGLKGKDLSKVQSLEEILNKTPSGSFNYKKLAENETYFKNKLSLSDLKDTSPEVQEIYKKNQNLFENELKEMGTIIHFGVRIKENGGSMGVPRFSYLIKENNSDNYKIIEFKAQVDPAASALNLAQNTPDKRINEIMESYRPKENNGNIIKVLKTQTGFYIVREKVKPNFDGGALPTTPDEVQNHLDYAKHMFHWLGRSHAKQSGNYVEEFNDQLDELKPILEKLVDDHVNYFRKIYNDYQAPIPTDPTQSTRN